MGLKEIIFGLNAKPAFRQREEAVNALRRRLAGVVGGLIHDSKSSAAKERYRKILHTINTAHIYGFPSRALRAAGSAVTLGENVTTYLKDAKTGRVIEAGPNLISLPQHHVFYGNRLTTRGVMTIIHELAHGAVKNELMADLVSIRIASRAGMPQRAALAHLAGREVAYGRKGVEKAREYVSMAYAEARKKYGKLVRVRRRLPGPLPLLPRRGKGRQRPAFA